MCKAISLLIIAQSDRRRESLRVVLRPINEIVMHGVPENATQIRLLLAQEYPDAILLDGTFAGREIQSETWVLLKDIKIEYPDIGYLVLVNDNQQAQTAQAAGADQVLIDDFSAQAVYRALRQIVQNKTNEPSISVEERNNHSMYGDVVVGREHELTRLHELLDRTLTGQLQICFIIGEPGAGKSTLIREFVHEAQEAHADLLMAIGHCNGLTGLVDPYLPFRNVLNMLTGDVENKVAKGEISQENANRLTYFVRQGGHFLVEYGPDLLGLFIPGGALLGRALSATKLARQAGLLDKLKASDELPTTQLGQLNQTQVFEQFTSILHVITQQQPLILVLDDLQWADSGSIELLFHLTRHLAHCRLLLVGCYRHNDVAIGRDGDRHPLEVMSNEVKRYFGDVTIDLEQSRIRRGREFIDALLDSEPNRLDDEFRTALYDRTGGHPLFTAELLSNLQERNELMQDEAGHWVAMSNLDWETLPDRIEGVIEERVNRLDKGMRETLAIASVEGKEFTVQVIAQIQEARERQLLRHLSHELNQRHRLVREQGTTRLKGQRMASHFSFTHAPMRQYLYDHLGTSERLLLHGEVATILEQLYSGHVEQIAAQLALHYTAAGIAEKAIPYWLEAGRNANNMSAPHEAKGCFERALTLMEEVELEDKQFVEASLKQELGQTLEHLSEYATAKQYLETSLTLFVGLKNRQGIADTMTVLGHIAHRLGNYEAAREYYQQSLDIYRTLDNRVKQGRCLNYLGDVELALGAYDPAKAFYQESLQISEELNDPLGMADSLNNLGDLAQSQGSFDVARQYAYQSLSIYEEINNRWGIAGCLGDLGDIARAQGAYNEAEAFTQGALKIYREIGDRRGEANALNDLGNSGYLLGNYTTAKQYLEESHAIFGEIDNRKGMAMALELLGNISTALDDYVSARNYIEESLTIFREIGDRRGIAMSLNYLGDVAYAMEDYSAATQYLQESLSIFEELGDRQGIADIYNGLSDIAGKQGNFIIALHHAQRSLDMAEEMGDRHNVAQALIDLGRINQLLGNYIAAQEQFESSLNLSREMGARQLIAKTLIHLGMLESTLGTYTRAQQQAQEGLSIATEIGSVQLRADALNILGHIAEALGADEAAAHHFQESLTLYGTLEDQPGVASCLVNRGILSYVQKRDSEAQTHFEQSLAIYTELNDRHGMAAALNYLGFCAFVTGRLEEARSRFVSALELAMDLQVPPLALTSLTGLAELDAYANRYERAAQGVGLVLHHAASDDFAKGVSRVMFEALRKSLFVEEIETIVECMKSRELTEVASEILKNM